MNQITDRIENAAHKATHYIEEHPWASIACGLWPAAIAAEAAGAGEKKSEVTKEVHPKAAPATPLTDAQKRSAQTIDSAILSGDLDRLEKEMHTYAGRAGQLTEVVRQVRADLLPKGLVVGFSHGLMQRGDESKLHDEGHITIFSTKGGTALEVGTGTRDGACVGGPVRKMPDGSYVDGMLAYFDDPASFLKELRACCKINSSKMHH